MTRIDDTHCSFSSWLSLPLQVRLGAAVGSADCLDIRGNTIVLQNRAETGAGDESADKDHGARGGGISGDLLCLKSNVCTTVGYIVSQGEISASIATWQRPKSYSNLHRCNATPTKTLHFPPRLGRLGRASTLSHVIETLAQIFASTTPSQASTCYGTHTPL